MSRKYFATGLEAEFEPGSRGRVLRNLLGITRVRVNIGKAGFQFAHAPLIPRLMAELERGALARLTPCAASEDRQMALALAEVHAELILVHPFREGNGRLARLLALLMALQAGLPPLDFAPLTGTGKRRYIAGIHVAVGRNYGPLAAVFQRVIERSRRRAASSAR